MTQRSHWLTRIGRAAVSALLLFACASPAWAQFRGAAVTEIKGTIGAVIGGDSKPGHRVFGGSFMYFSPYGFWSVGPEILYMRASPFDEKLVVSGLSTVRFTDPERRVSGYATSGYSFVHSRQSGNAGQWAGVRVGLKVYVNDRVFVSSEVGVFGGRPIVTVNAGYVLSSYRP